MWLTKTVQGGGVYTAREEDVSVCTALIVQSVFQGSHVWEFKATLARIFGLLAYINDKGSAYGFLDPIFPASNF